MFSTQILNLPIDLPIAPPDPPKIQQKKLKYVKVNPFPPVPAAATSLHSPGSLPFPDRHDPLSLLPPLRSAPLRSSSPARTNRLGVRCSPNGREPSPWHWRQPSLWEGALDLLVEPPKHRGGGGWVGHRGGGRGSHLFSYGHRLECCPPCWCIFSCQTPMARPSQSREAPRTTAPFHRPPLSTARVRAALFLGVPRKPSKTVGHRPAGSARVRWDGAAALPPGGALQNLPSTN